MKQANAVIVATVLATGATAWAQPAPADPAPTGAVPVGPNANPLAPTDERSPDDRPTTTVPADAPPTPPDPPRGTPFMDDPPPLDPYGGTKRASKPAPPRPAILFPEVLTTPTGWLLPAAVLYSKTALDTGGGVTSDNRVGLGDVAEFGVATTDQVRERDTLDNKAERIQPYVTASFRLGVSENRLFGQQPGITLGFRKSFERNHNGQKTRIAELTLVASKHLGPRAALHVGGSLWDASLQSTATLPDGGDQPEYTLHGHGYQRQIRAFGGIQAQPLPRSEILIDLGWAPELCYQCTDRDKIRLRPELSWGVRYEVARFMHLSSGVRVPDIGDFNLLDAQIFGQVTFTSFALKGAVDRLK